MGFSRQKNLCVPRRQHHKTHFADDVIRKATRAAVDEGEMMTDLYDLLVRWMVSDSYSIIFSLSAAFLVPIAVAMRRFRAMGLRVSFTLSL